MSIADAPIKGDPEAAFVLIEYSDYQCPYCARFESEILPGIEAAHIRAGRLRLAFRHHPIETLHPFAPRAAAAAVCSGEQGRFWEYHELLFANVRKLDDTVLRELAVSADLDAPAFFVKVMRMIRNVAFGMFALVAVATNQTLHATPPGLNCEEAEEVCADTCGWCWTGVELVCCGNYDCDEPYEDYACWPS